MPQSTSRRFPAASTRYFDPVTVPAAPKKVSLAISVSLYRIPPSVPCRGLGPSLNTKRDELPARPVCIGYRAIRTLSSALGALLSDQRDFSDHRLSVLRRRPRRRDGQCRLFGQEPSFLQALGYRCHV